MGVLQTYQQKIHRGEIRDDADQQSVMVALATLEHQLLQKTKSSSIWQRILIILGLRSEVSSIKGLYLYGGVGRGKSMLMDLFDQTLPDDLSHQRWHFHAFMRHIHTNLNRYRQQGVHDPLSKVASDLCQQITLLCFDEFFVQDIADAMILGRLFELMFKGGIVVVATSNTAIAELYAHGLQRQQFLPFIAIFQQNLISLSLNGKTDYRTLSLNGLPRYYLENQTDRYEKSYHAAIQNLHPSPLVISILGRELRFAHHHRGILRVGFSELCEQPLAAQDFLMIAENIAILFLDNVPNLTPPEMNSPARRFLYLIDCLYEAKCQLFMLSNTPMNSLYQKGRLAHEFNRATSRLHEMQTDAYLHEAKSLVKGGLS